MAILASFTSTTSFSSSSPEVPSSPSLSTRRTVIEDTDSDTVSADVDILAQSQNSKASD